MITYWALFKLLLFKLLLYLLAHQIDLRLFLRRNSQGTDFHFKTQMPELSFFSGTGDTLLMLNSLKRQSAMLKSCREIVLERGRKQRTLFSPKPGKFLGLRWKLEVAKKNKGIQGAHFLSQSLLLGDTSVLNTGCCWKIVLILPVVRPKPCQVRLWPYCPRCFTNFSSGTVAIIVPSGTCPLFIHWIW